MSKIIVLLVDNDLDFLNTRAEFLERADYRVLKASNLAQAEQLFRQAHIHLAILDIRMVDDDDDKDVSGLMLARSPAFRSIPKIILTGRPSFQDVRQVMRPASDGLPAAVGFLSKQEGPEAMIEAVQEAVAQYVRLKMSLAFRWQGERGPLSFAHLVCLVEPDLDNAHLPERADEIQDLFRKLYYDYDQVTCAKLFWREASGAALGILAYAQEKEDQFIAIYGRPAQAERRLYAPGLPAEGAAKTLAAETSHFAAAAWTVNGAYIQELETFATFYKQRSERQIRTAIEYLFHTALAPWYQQGRSVEEEAGLPRVYGQRLNLQEFSEFKLKMQALTKEALACNLVRGMNWSSDQLLIQFTGGRTASFAEPLSRLYDDDVFPASRIVYAATPGCLDVGTILVDRAGCAWLAACAQAELAPIWLDFASLETDIRFKLEADDLEALYEFEERLLKANHLDEAISPGDVLHEHRKMSSAIQAIRRMASEQAGNELAPYYISLFFCAIKGLAAYDPALRHTRAEIAAWLYRLLLAAMLCEKIEQMKSESASLTLRAGAELCVDPVNREVRIGEKQIVLTATEFDLLLYLYQHAGKLCKRQDIMRDVFHLVDASRNDQDSLINTTMGRLRKKIEQDPGRPQYVVTVRGVGYKLITQPQ